MEIEEPFIKNTGRKLLSTELPNLEKTVLRINEKPKTTNPVWKSDETTSAKNPIYEKPDFADDIQKLRAVPEGNTGIRFKAMMGDHTEQDEKEESAGYTSNNKSSSSFYDDYVEKSKTNNSNHISLLPRIKSVNDIGKNFNNFSYTTDQGTTISPSERVIEFLNKYYDNKYNVSKTTYDLILDDSQLESLHNYLSNGIKNANRPANIGKGIWEKQVTDDLKWIDDMFGKSSKFAKALKMLPAITIGIDTARGIKGNVEDKAGKKETISDAVIDISLGAGEAVLSGLAGAAVGGVPGAIVGILVGLAYTYYADNKKYDKYDGKTFKQHLDSLF